MAEAEQRFSKLKSYIEEEAAQLIVQGTPAAPAKRRKLRIPAAKK